MTDRIRPFPGIVALVDAEIAAVRAAGLEPSCLVLTYAQRWQLTEAIHGTPSWREPGAHPYAQFMAWYQGLPIIPSVQRLEGSTTVMVGAHSKDWTSCSS